MRKFSRALGPKIVESNRQDREDGGYTLLTLRNVYGLAITPKMLSNYERAVNEGWQPVVVVAVLLHAFVKDRDPSWIYLEGVLREQTRRSHAHWTRKLRWLK
jgi:hypothetical protein